MGGIKGWHVFSKGSLQSLRVGFNRVLPNEDNMELKCATKSKFFCLGSNFGKSSNLDQVQKRGWATANRCYLCQAHEGSIDHLLLHCKKTREVWKLFFTLFGVHWVFPSLVRETLLGWKGAFVGTKRKTVWNAGPLCLFWSVWKTMNKIAFNDGVLSLQKLKAFFVYLFWLESKLFIKYGPSTLIDFTD